MAGRVKKHLEDYLSEFVYGGMDGSVTTFAVVAGATGASFSTKVLLVLGFANLVADGFSMSVGSYLSKKSEMELMVKRGESIDNQPSPIINGLTTYAAFLLVGFVPLLAYTVDIVFNLESKNVFLISVILTEAAFFTIGFLKSKVAHAPLLRALTETVALGTIAAAFSYVLGDLLERLIA